ncbi:hypothetical protein ACTL6U_10065 [Rhodovibrionaceae bacterium A322]
MKLCLCISGQVRGDLNALRQLKANLEDLASSVETTVIISVWDRPGAKLDGALGQHQMERIFQKDLAQIIPSAYYGNGFWTHFPGLYDRLLDQEAGNLQQKLSAIFPEAILDIEPEIMDLEMPEPKSNVHVKRMLYKIWRCNEIKKKLETSHGPFDAVMRLRPDSKLILTSSIATLSFDQGEIYIPGSGDRPGRTNDVVALGSSSTLDSYAALFARTLTGTWSDIHYELNSWLKEQGLTEKPPQGFDSLGLEANKLLGIQDVKGINPFIDLLGLLQNNLSQDSCLKTIDRELKRKTDRGERNSLFHMRARYFTARGQHNDALNSFLQAELSSEEMLDFVRDRNVTLIYWLMQLCRPLPSQDPSAVMAEIDKDLLSACLQDNLARIFALPVFVGFFQAQRIEEAYRQRGTETLLETPLPEDPPDFLADLYRDKAMELEGKDLPKAKLLMARAQKIRPKGLVIQDKLRDYTIRLAKTNKPVTPDQPQNS